MLPRLEGIVVGRVLGGSHPSYSTYSLVDRVGITELGYSKVG